MFKANVEIPNDRVYDLISTGLECGNMATFGVDSGRLYREAWDVNGDKPEAFAKVKIYDRLCDVDSLVRSIYLNDSNLQQGLAIMAEHYPHHFNNFIEENEDAITGDVFLQCVVFGEVIYG